MTGKQLVRVAAALVIALFLWGAAEILTGRGDERSSTAVIGPVAADAVDRITIARSQDTIRLERSGTAWRVNGFDADSATVANLLDTMSEAIQGEIVAESRGSHARMDVDSAAGRRITLASGETTVGDALVGKSGRAYGTVYLRRTGADAVYLARTELGSFVSRSLNDWRDKRILSIPADSIGRVSVERGNRRYAIRRDSTRWVFQDGAPTDSSAAARLVGQFNPLTTQGDLFATPAQLDSLDFSRPDARVVLVNSRGDTLAALLFDERDNRYWVRRSGIETVYQIFSWRMDEIAPSDSTLRPKTESEGT
jgi:hypothetical protein